jgi:hypothetical protein
MEFLRISVALMLTLTAGIGFAAETTFEKWDRDAGKPVPRLVGTAWLGTPVLLDAVKGNTVVLAFWNMDVPWC